MKRILTSALLAGAVGCAYVSPPVAVVGPQAAINSLAGEWWGDYSSDGPIERRGSIHFTLIEGEDHAHGDVLMVPAGSTNPYGRFAGDSRPYQIRGPETLSIRIVRIEDGTIRGDLEPYWDPDRDTSAITTFLGTLGENTIAGTFTTIFESGAFEARGRWKVTRVKPAQK
jgi:hypothetical protein